MVELGRLGIFVQVALLSAFLAQPRQGHLEACITIDMSLGNSRNKNSKLWIPGMEHWCLWKDISFRETALL
jgi:hypothetical protein